MHLLSFLALPLIANSFHAFGQAAPVLSLDGAGESTPILVGLGPSATTLGQNEYVAFQAHDSSNAFWVAQSSDNSNFAATKYNLSTSTAPAIANLNGQLFVAYTVGTTLYYGLYQPGNGIYATAPVLFNGSQAYANSQPTLAALNNELYISWVSNGSGSSTTIEAVAVNLQGSFQSVPVTNTSPDGAQPQIGAAVALASYKGQMYYAYQAQGNWGHELVVCHTTSSTSNTCSSFPSITTHSGVAAAVLNSSLYLSFKDPSSDNYLNITGTNDGVNFTTPATAYSSVRVNGNSEISPAMNIAPNGALNFFFVSNDSDHNLDLVHN